MNLRERQRADTRRAILDAVGAQLAAAGMEGFSIQAVADRAGVTHRTVYNHFPTREALSDAFGEHVEAAIGAQGLRPRELVDLGTLPDVARESHEQFEAHAAPLEAYVLMTIATRAAARVYRERSKALEELLEEELGPLEPGVAKLVTAGLRLFISSTGWFVLRRHCELTPAEAGRVSEWAVKALLDAARRGEVPKRASKRGKKK